MRSANRLSAGAFRLRAGSAVGRLVARAGLLAGAFFPASVELEAQRCTREVGDSLAVLEVAEGIIAADNERDLDRVLGHYRPDAVLMPPGERPVRGRPNIRPRYVALFEQYDPAIVGEVERVEVCGDLAVVSGRNGGWLRGRGGRPDRRLSDVYVMLLRRESERWRIARLIWHPDGDNEGGRSGR